MRPVPRKAIARLGLNIGGAKRVGYREVAIPMDCAVELHAFLKVIRTDDYNREYRGIGKTEGGRK